VLFDDMFDWLDEMRRVFENYPETLFVLRAHPDEDRPGKRSRESVADWVGTNQLQDRENVVFFGASERASSYELIRRSKIVLIYNSSIGLEATIMGKPVLCAGRARFTTIPAVYFPDART
jgi:UDP-N-acetylglucosamine 2-epimerase